MMSAEQLSETTSSLSYAERLCCSWLPGRKKHQRAPEWRTVVPNFQLEHDHHSFRSNRIQTSKYTLVSLVPKNLLEQFHRVANIYFLLVVLLNFIPEINAFGKEISVTPVLFVLVVTMVKDSFEDRRRHLADRRINNYTCRVFHKESGRYVKTRWQDVRVGDLVHLSCNEAIPADIVLLRSKDPLGLCYLETASLDGESSLKQRQTPQFLPQHKEIYEAASKFHLECEIPNNRIYHFIGCIVPENSERIPLNKENLLLRDCRVKNADFVEGIVVYAGHDTKTMLNNKGPRYKRSKLECFMNRDVIWCIFLLILICMGGAIGTMLWEIMYPPNDLIPYFQSGEQNLALSGFYAFLSYIIIFQVIIPISLYVTIEIIKLGQVYLVEQDVEMPGVRCRALNIPEELGQVEVVLSDKTGTLTENCMVFRSCSILGMDFPHYQGHSPNTETRLTPVPSSPHKKDFRFVPDPKLQEMLISDEGFSTVQEFFILMTLCNTVMVSHYPHTDQMNASGFMMDQVGNGVLDSSSGSGSLLRSNSPLEPESLNQSQLSPSSTPSRMTEPIYEAESPDEIALVEAAFCYNFRLMERTPFSATVFVPGYGRVEYQLLCVLPFDAVRKRMSVVVENPFTGRKVLLAKGADSAIYPILANPDSEEKKEIRLRTQYHLNDYSRRGLRVLTMARKELEDGDFDDWLREHRRVEAAVGLDDAERDQLLHASYSAMENQLQLLGATGIEDKLQDGVCDTISALRAANIIVWVLTGDKQETAVNVAFSCQLFTPEMELLTINARSKSTAAEHLQFYLNELRQQSSPTKKALVIDGKTLMYLMEMEGEFVALLQASSAVLCCRTTPLQKASIVKLVKERLHVLTLAIGDGANDVSMLQTADVGVGISGQEGLQAVMASDFALTRFCHLKKLLLVHGHWNYDRLTSVILYFFYKNSSVIFTIFWFQIYCGFSGAVMIDQLYLMLINVFFTSIPPIALGVLDQDCPVRLLLNHPTLYTQGQGSKLYSRKFFWLNMADSLYQSLVMFFIPYGVFYDSTAGIWEFGTTVCTIIIFVHLMVFALESRSWTWIHVGAVIFSMASYLGVVFLYNAYSMGLPFLQNPYMVAQHLFPQPSFWFCLVLSSLLACLPRLVIKCLRNTISPTQLQAVLRQSCQSPSTISTVSWSRLSNDSNAIVAIT